MDKQYDSLDELITALKANAHTNITAFLDNDQVLFLEGENTLLELDPTEVQEQALELLGINTQIV